MFVFVFVFIFVFVFVFVFVGGQVALVPVPLRVHLGPRGLPGLLWRWQEGGEEDHHHLLHLHCHHHLLRHPPYHHHHHMIFIPHICHGRADGVRVNFFWPV